MASQTNGTTGIQTAQKDRTGRAIVIGAGMGGLLAARVLADVYEEVLILERDALPRTGEQRKGIPQGHHAHGLMARGRAIIEDLFPGITQELIDRGAMLGDTTADARWFQNGDYLLQAASGTHTLVLSRPLLEGTIRERLCERNNVRIFERRAVRGLLATEDRTRVTGVRANGDPAMGGDENLPADLVVDASGRGSQLPAWLEALGYERPQERRAGVETRYASRLFHRAPEHLPGTFAVIVAASPAVRRGAVMLAQEGDRWLVTLAGRAGEQPPTDLAAFTDYARSLPAREVADVISAAEPIGDAAVYGFPTNHRRFYEHLTRFPGGILPFADAICGFNPIYAQGMSVAAIEAAALRRCLADGRDGLASRFFAEISSDVDDAWKLAAGADLRFAPDPSAAPRMARFMAWYMDRLHIAARREPAVSIAFREVVNLNQRPASLLRPAIALRVLRGNVHPRKKVFGVRQPIEPAAPFVPVPTR